MSHPDCHYKPLPSQTCRVRPQQRCKTCSGLRPSSKTHSRRESVSFNSSTALEVRSGEQGGPLWLQFNFSLEDRIWATQYSNAANLQSQGIGHPLTYARKKSISPTAVCAVALERRATRLKAHYCHTVVMNTITRCSTHQTGSNQLGKMISLVFLLQTASLDICKINNYTCSSRECIWSQTYITYKSILDVLCTSTAILINGYSNYLKAHTVLLDSPLHKLCNEKLIQLIFVRVDAIFNFTQMSLRMWGIVLVFTTACKCIKV